MGSVLSSITSSSWKQYNSYLQQWVSFCTETGISYLDPKPTHVCQFLTNLVNAGKSYNTINTARSAVSLLSQHQPTSVGSHPLVKRVVRAAGKLNPPKPKYETVWNPAPVTEHIKTMWPHDSMSLENLSKKLAFLLAFTTSHRVQTLSLINIDNIQFNEDGAEIFIPEAIKTSGPNRPQPCLILPKFNDHPYWCVVQCLQDFLTMTTALRKEKTLFVSLSAPHKPVGTQTISRWIKNVLQASGVNTTVFTAHSVRHVSTSSALRNGVDIESIRKRAGWTSKSATFARFYNRPITNDTHFARSVFK